MPLAGERRGESLTDLVSRAQSGDSTAWDDIVRKFERLVWKIANSFGLDSAAREDVFQNTWLRLVQSIHTIRQPEALPGWLCRTAKNEALALIAKNRLVPTDHMEDRRDPHAADADAGMLEAELRVALRSAFDKLSERCQRILRLLTCVPQLSYAEIAELLDVSHGYIGPSRLRCVNDLRAMRELAPFLVRGSAP